MASLVFKVKYEETLRRFNVAINGDQQMDLSMEGLRLKICSLFNLSDADFRLTYEDEDDDVVTLVEDADLHDVVRQGLNPVRITVCLNSVQSTQSSAPSGNAASSIPSPQIGQPNVAEALSHVLLNLGKSIPNLQQNTNPEVAKIVRSVQDPLAQALSKLSLDVSSKAASTSPILGELFEGLSKIGQSYVNAATSNSGSSSVTSHNDVGNDSKPNAEGRNDEGFADEGIKNNDNIGKADPTKPASKITQAAGGDTSVKYSPCSPFSFDKEKSVCNESSSNKKSSSCGMKKSKDAAQKKGVGFNAGFLRSAPMNASETALRDAAERMRGFQSYRESMLLGECPFGGISLTDDQIFKPYNRSLSKADSLGSIFHKGVRCDGCGVLPITGPRFKSKVKYDYDLCSICFSRMGNDVDYARIDFPLTYGHPWSLKTPDASLRQCIMKKHAPKHLRSRLDSRFITDVNVVDGTAMAPLTPFTKIWRMRNNGTLPWNHGLQLLWIGGDRFSPSDSVEIQVPPTGVDVGLELDIAVDFIAPELPGRYISYWRMAEPSGHKFGQRVWVQIQVDPSVDLTRESSPMLNLNLPPDSNEAIFPEVVDVKTEPEFIVEVGESSTTRPIPEQNNIETLSLNFPTNGDLLIDGDVVYPSAATADRPVSPPVGPLPFSYPEVDAQSYNVKDASAPLPSMTLNEEAKAEEKLLKELSQMGFKQVDLNKEVLRMNEYDLDRSVDDLCDVSEWDPILEELKEMGFEDKETNKKLLVKNNGSITRVVMDLIAEEKAE
ncbi:protein JOKA2-like isoform X2 [Silene latifolia]|uniref:protein JOKA2-like isoform X2 n=1 Tax=Silene latifolia TaxID=37657 RepID=UPI003D783F0A